MSVVRHMKKTLCDKCNTEIKNSNFDRHWKACDGAGPYLPRIDCKWCKVKFTELDDRSNHTRWCSLNPKRENYNKNLEFQRSKITEKSIEKRAESIKQAHASGKYSESYKNKKGKPGKPHTEETKLVLKKKALGSPHRRLLKSIRNYKKTDGTIVCLDSSWEEELAKCLDSQNIPWVRPDPIKWFDHDGISHNYFPDFYLPEYDLYLDPKNDQAYRVQEQKIKCLTEQIKNLIIIRTLVECKNFKV